MKYVNPINLYREAVNINRGRLLGITVRDKGIRLAVSHADNKYSEPLRDLAKKKIGVAQVQTLQNLIYGYSISGLVIGYPFLREMAEPTAGAKTKRFVDDLTKTGKFEDMNYTFWDETLKSKSVDYLTGLFKPVDDSSTALASLTEIVDHCTAWGIVQGYLEFFNRNQDQTTSTGKDGHLYFSKLNQDQTTFIGEHGYLDSGNPNPE